MQQINPILSVGSLNQISDKILNSLGVAGDSIIYLVKGIFDGVVIPLAGVSVLCIIFFLVLAIAKSKRRRDGEDLEEQIKNLIIAVATFLVISGYATFAWGLI